MILIFPTTLFISVVTVVYLRNRSYEKRQKELDVEFPPSITSKSFGGLDGVKELRWKYHFGYIGNSNSRRERL